MDINFWIISGSTLLLRISRLLCLRPGQLPKRSRRPWHMVFLTLFPSRFKQFESYPESSVPSNYLTNKGKKECRAGTFDRIKRCTSSSLAGGTEIIAIESQMDMIPVSG